MESLDPDEATRHAWLAAAGEVVRVHLDAVHGAPTQPRPHALTDRPAIGEAPLAGGIGAALAHVEAAAEASLSATAPGFMAYIPGGGLLAGAVADFVAAVLNRYTGIAEAAPGLVALENDVLEWLCREMGYGPSAAGLFTSGGSLATLLAVTSARDAHAGPDTDLRTLVAYTSAEAHGSVFTAFRLAGLPSANLRAVAVDDCRRMDAEALRDQVRADRAAGLRPFLVIAAAGTTNTGAIDPLVETAGICADEGLWLHVDGAYGGAFALCDEGRRRLRGIERADSITLDPHKGFFLHYGTGCVLFRAGPPRGLAEGDHDEAYLQDLQPAAGVGSQLGPAAFGLELTRPFRGLRLWLPLMLHGAAAFREQLSEKLALAKRLEDGLRSMAADGSPIEVVAPAQLSVVPFRLSRRPGEALAQWNARNAAFLEAINDRRRTFLSSTMLSDVGGSVLTLRACVLSHRTQAQHIAHGLEDIAAAEALQSQ